MPDRGLADASLLPGYGNEFTGNKHNSEGNTNSVGEPDPGPYWRRMHRDWRSWIGAVFLAAALAIYVLNDDLAWFPNGHQKAVMPVSAANCDYSETSVGVTRKHCTKVDATMRKRRPCTKLTGPLGLWFRSGLACGSNPATLGGRDVALAKAPSRT